MMMPKALRTSQLKGALVRMMPSGALRQPLLSEADLFDVMEMTS